MIEALPEEPAASEWGMWLDVLSLLAVLYLFIKCRLWRRLSSA